MKKSSLASLPLLLLPTALVAQPNFILIMTDDQGYQDLGCFGSPDIRTPHIDALAKNGLRATSFYASSSVCTPSRAAIQTGKYHPHVNLWNGGENTLVFYPDSPGGMSPDEVTIAEVLKPKGYACGLFGKWHLGSKKPYLPTAQGYDEFYGLPSSNDHWLPAELDIAQDVVLREGVKREDLPRLAQEGRKWRMKTVLIRGTQGIEYPADQSTLTERYFNEAISFIDKAKANNKPFYVCITPNMPHTPLFPNAAFAGKSARGPYGDVVEEIDAKVGQLVEYLKDNALLENTVIIFISDNGPWLIKEQDSGSALPLRNGKRSLYEGGVRVPCVMHYPAGIKAGQVTDEILSTIDILPTFAALAGAEAPEGIDGLDLSAFLLGKTDKSPRDTFFYYDELNNLVAVRQKEWKTIFDHPARDYAHTMDKAPADLTRPYPLSLFNLKQDISETTNRMPENQQP